MQHNDENPEACPNCGSTDSRLLDSVGGWDATLGQDVDVDVYECRRCKAQWSD